MPLWPSGKVRDCRSRKEGSIPFRGAIFIERNKKLDLDHYAIKTGDFLLINLRQSEGSHTAANYGWDDDMDKFLGKELQVHTIDGSAVVFRECSRYTWNINDLEYLKILEKISFKGEKVLFNVEELF